MLTDSEMNNELQKMIHDPVLADEWYMFYCENEPIIGEVNDLAKHYMLSSNHRLQVMVAMLMMQSEIKEKTKTLLYWDMKEE